MLPYRLKLLVTLALLGTLTLGAQAPVPIPMVENLTVYVLQGQGAQNDATRAIGALTVVEVRDENSRPVENAEVVFRVPANGPGGVFPQQKQSLVVRTNAQGQAEMKGLIINSQMGGFEIQVTATYEASMGKTVIRQVNGPSLISVLEVPKKKSFFVRYRWPLILGVAAGTGLGIWLGTRGGGTATTTTPPPTINPGPIVIGGPQ